MALTNAEKSEEVIRALLGDFFVMVHGQYLEPIEGYNLHEIYKAQAFFGNWVPAKLVNGEVRHLFTAVLAAQIDSWSVGRRHPASGSGIISVLCRSSLQTNMRLSPGESLHISFKPELT